MTVVGKLDLHNKSIQTTLDYFDKIFILSYTLKKNGYSYDKDYFYNIEFTEDISIIHDLEYIGYFEKEPLYITNINELGITFYVVEQYLIDGFIFVPMSNIRTIHTIEREQVKKFITREL